MKALRLIGIGFGIFILGDLAANLLMALTGWDSILGIGLLASLIASIAIPVRMGRQNGTTKHSANKHNPIIDETEKWLLSIAKSQRFETYIPAKILLKAGEFAILSGETNLMELVKPDNRQYLGTRIKLGSIPIYFGSSVSRSATWKITDRGEVAITNKRLIFLGGTKQITVDWNDLLGIDAAKDAIVVSSTKRSTPYAIVVNNGLLWSEAAKLMARLRPPAKSIENVDIILPSWST